MERTKIDAYLYAIQSGDKEMFDYLAKDLDHMDDEEKNTLLANIFMSAKSNDIIEYVVDKYNFDLNYVDEKGSTLMHYAASSSNPDAIEYLYKKGLDINAKDSAGCTPVFVAAKDCENPEVIEAFEKLGVDIFEVDEYQRTLLHVATAFNKDPKITRYLLDKGFDPKDLDDESYTPLHSAAYCQSNVHVIKELLKTDVDVFAETEDGDNVLHLAASNPNADIARYFLPIFMTGKTNHADESCMEVLLTRGSNPELVAEFLKKMREEQLFYAAMNKYPLVLEALINQGYDVNQADINGMTVLMMAAQFNTNPHVMDMLTVNRAIVSAVDDDGRNVVHYAAANTDSSIYDYIITQDEYKNLLEVEDNAGNKPEYYLTNKEDF